MTNPAVRIEGLSKVYRIGGEHRADYKTLRDTLRGLFRRTVGEPNGRREVWALQDLWLNVQEGEVLGVIGRNGAGKSTLLKILSRITEPTTGRALLGGRIASLLEVGTGFHPELTGRENVFLNGAILGMSRREIRCRFDDIVEFAEVQKFLDTPVKHYSSGMYVRLAFAVAAHLTPEILIIDEVLAVGDVEFQRRCLGRMEQVAKSGRTVLFVSHNMVAVEALCSRVLLLGGGRTEFLGATGPGIRKYLSGAGRGGQWDIDSSEKRRGSGRVRIESVELRDSSGALVADSPYGQDVSVHVRYHAVEPVADARFGVAVLDEKGERVLLCDTFESGPDFELLKGVGSIRCAIRAPQLLPGSYALEVYVTDSRDNENLADSLRPVGAFSIVPDGSGLRRVSLLELRDRGRMLAPCVWSTEGGS